MICSEEVIVKYHSTSLPNPVMVFGRDVWILVRNNNLHSSFRIVTKNVVLHDAISSNGLLSADIWLDNVIEEL